MSSEEDDADTLTASVPILAVERRALNSVRVSVRSAMTSTRLPAQARPAAALTAVWV